VHAARGREGGLRPVKEIRVAAAEEEEEEKKGSRASSRAHCQRWKSVLPANLDGREKMRRLLAGQR